MDGHRFRILPVVDDFIATYSTASRAYHTVTVARSRDQFQLSKATLIT